MTDPEDGKKKLDGQKWYNVMFQTHRPHTGTQSRLETMMDVLRLGTKITAKEAQNYWEVHYESSVVKCSHIFWSNRCPYQIAGAECDVRSCFIL